MLHVPDFLETSRRYLLKAEQAVDADTAFGHAAQGTIFVVAVVLWLGFLFAVAEAVL